MRGRLWLVVLLAFTVFLFIGQPPIPKLEDLTANDDSLHRALVTSPVETKRLQLWLGSRNSRERLDLAAALLNINWLERSADEQRWAAYSLATLSDWPLGNRRASDVILNGAIYLLLTHQHPVPAADLAAAEALYPAFVDALERQPPLSAEEDGEARRMFMDTEACLRFVQGKHDEAARLWREILAVESAEEQQSLYQRRLEAATSKATLLPAEDIVRSTSTESEASEQTTPPTKTTETMSNESENSDAR